MKKQMKTMALVSLMGSALLLTGCGGGGGSSSGTSINTGSVPADYRNLDTNQDGVISKSEAKIGWDNASSSERTVVASYLQVPEFLIEHFLDLNLETTTSTDTGGTGVRDYSITNSLSNTAVSGSDFRVAVKDIQGDWVEDTGADVAWSNGWTGKGVKIAIIDDFNDDDISLGGTVSIDGKTSLSHGDVVSTIAGGSHSISAGGIGSTNTFYGVAAGSTLSEHHVELGSEFVYADFLTEVNLALASDARVLNLSLGVDYDPSNTNHSLHVTHREGNLAENQIAVVAAGNEDNQSSMNLVAVSLDNAQTIVAGSFNEAGDGYASDKSHYTDEGFSNINFLLARDTAISPSLRGTSFAAPRISGAAAILMHKFPTHDGSDVVSELMSSADDETFDGESVKVMNLNAALAP